MRFFFVDPSRLSGARACLEGDEARHIKNVLRLRPGDAIGLLDGAGSEYTGVIEAIAPERVEVAVTGHRPAAGRSSMRVSVAQGFLKEKKMDRLVHQLSEMGVDRWVPFVSSRSVARPEAARAQARSRRWRKIAVEALKQCRRGNLMQIDAVAGFDRVVALSALHDLSILFWEEETSEHLTAATARPGGPASVLLVIGPEGGFTPEEARAAKAAGFRVAGLGPRVMRAETAAVAACAIAQYLFGDLGPGQKNLDKNSPLA
ncbi:MAG: 16S rRNA (uracil(1498)-N(3))-methyltransferase [Desulfobacterales bacterium]|jgi:16S rRNA (uracil1498-N3)-methyltransferase|nr:16S rRNA (uracil(1498)-N(3))-methyltransferase [Desulfobacterales bacterium]